MATACCLAAQGQTPLSVAYQKTLQLPVAGATAAYSLDPNIADATAANGVLEIVGKAPGSTNIVVVTSAGRADASCDSACSASHFASGI